MYARALPGNPQDSAPLSIIKVLDDLLFVFIY